MGSIVQRSSTFAPWSLNRAGWLKALRYAVKEIGDDHVTLLAGGVAFFGFLAVFPAMAALVAVYGILFDPADVAEQMMRLRGVAPPEVTTILQQQLNRLTVANSGTLSGGAIVALLIALWSASRGSLGLIEATNLAYDERETRGFIRRNLLSLGLTLGAVLFTITVLAVVALIPAWLAWTRLDLDPDSSIGLMAARWLALIGLVMVATAALYAIAPDRKPARWQWLTPGSTFVTVTVVAASALFSLYVSTMGSYNEIYGSLGAVAIFLLWLYLISLLILLGAEINQAVEKVVLNRTTTYSPSTNTSSIMQSPSAKCVDHRIASLLQKL